MQILKKYILGGALDKDSRLAKKEHGITSNFRKRQKALQGNVDTNSRNK